MSAQSQFGLLSGLSHSRGSEGAAVPYVLWRSHQGFECLKICRNRLSHPSPMFLCLTLFLFYFLPSLLLYLFICLCISAALILFHRHDVFFLSMSLCEAQLQRLDWRCCEVKTYAYKVCRCLINLLVLCNCEQIDWRRLCFYVFFHILCEADYMYV